MCLTTSHQGHTVSSIKDKVVRDDKISALEKWNKYFLAKRAEFKLKKDALNKLLKDLEEQKMHLLKQISQNYDQYCETFEQSKPEILKHIQDLHTSELESLEKMGTNVNTVITSLSDTLAEMENRVLKNLANMTNKEILSLDITQFVKADAEHSRSLENIMNEKLQIKFRKVQWTEEALFQRTENNLEEVTNLTTEQHVKNTVVFFGDSKSKVVLSFDLVSQKWDTIECSAGCDYDNFDYSCATRYDKDTLLLTGGCIYSNYRNTATKSVFLAKFISPKEIMFSRFKSMNIERFSHGMSIVRGIPFVYGGHNGFQTLSSSEYYDKKLNVWKPGPMMNTEREIFAHCAVKDRYIYVFGGFNDNHLDSIERYDVVQDKWKTLQVRLKKTLQNSCAVCVKDDLIAVVGGYNGVMHKSIDLFNTNDLTWMSVDIKMKVARRKAHCYTYEEKVGISFTLDIYIRWRRNRCRSAFPGSV